MIVWGSHIDVRLFVLAGRMVSGALDDGDAKAVVEAATVGLSGAVAETLLPAALVIAGAEAVVVGAVAIDAGVEVLAVEASEIDADAEDPEPIIADRLLVAVFVSLPELLGAERTV